MHSCVSGGGTQSRGTDGGLADLDTEGGNITVGQAGNLVKRALPVADRLIRRSARLGSTRNRAGGGIPSCNV